MESDNVITIYLNPPDSSKTAFEAAEDIATIIDGKNKGNVAYDEFSIFNVTQNKDYDTRLIDMNNFTGAKFIAYIKSNNGSHDPDKEIFTEILLNFIVKMREVKYLVVGVGDIEDLIVERTGWNWTEHSQIQPTH